MYAVTYDSLAEIRNLVAEEIGAPAAAIDPWMPLIFVVDDEPLPLRAMRRVLRDTSAKVLTFESPAAALEAMRQAVPDIVISDFRMPEMDGIEFLKQVRELAPMTVRMLLTGYSDPTTTIGAINTAEIYRFLTKPFQIDELRRAVSDAAALAYSHHAVRVAGGLPEAPAYVARLASELSRTQDAMLLGLAMLAESRDDETGEHVFRVQRYARTIAEELANDERYAAELSVERIDLLHRAAPLHDIGKVGVPDHILRKPAALTADEYRVIQQHTVVGARVFDRLAAVTPDNPVLPHARDIARWHHERWDGAGYPDGRAGEQIPLFARIISVADAYDAMTSARVYKPAIKPAQAVEAIVAASGSQFDPAVVEAFLRCQRGLEATESDETRTPMQ